MLLIKSMSKNKYFKQPKRINSYTSENQKKIKFSEAG